MDNSFIQSQHPVVEELLTNKYFGDTLLVCANGHLTDNKLAVGLLFPALLTSDIFALPIENVLLVPDYTMEEIGREFEKLILGGSVPLATSSPTSTASPGSPQDISTTGHTQVIVVDQGLEGVTHPELGRTVQSVPCSSMHSVSTSSLHSIPGSSVHSLPGSSVHSLPGSVHSLPGSVHSLPGSTLPLEHPTSLNTLPGSYAHSQLVGTQSIFGEVPESSTYGTYLTFGNPTFYAASAEEEDDVTDDLKNDDNLIIDIDQDPLDQSDVTVSNGYSENCENIEISSQTENSIQIYLETNHNHQGQHRTSRHTQQHSPHQHKTHKKSVSFLEPEQITQSQSLQNLEALASDREPQQQLSSTNQLTRSRNSQPTHPREQLSQPRLRRRKTKLRIEEYEDEDVDMIENLNEIVDVSTAVESSQEALILEDRKPGRPRTKPGAPTPDTTGVTKFKMESALHVDKGTYKCEECGKVLSCRGSLNRHLLVHSDGKPFKCKYCPKTFREAAKRSTHERVHTGSKPYACKLCTKSFRTATQRTVHLSSHSKEKPFRCTVCGQTFVQKYNMKLHVKKFH